LGCGSLPQKIHNVSFTQLQALWAVANSGSYDSAGKLIGLRGKSVRFHVRELEQELGVLLFKGRPSEFNRLVKAPSDAGDIMLYYAEQILMISHDALQAVRELSDAAAESSLCLGATPCARGLLAPVLGGRFMPAHPEVSVDLHVADAQTISASVAAGRLDCGVVGGDIPREFRDIFQCVQVASEMLVLAVPAGHVCATWDAVEPNDLYSLDFCVYCTGGHRHQPYNAVLQACGIDPNRLRVRAHVDCIESAKSMVVSGAACAVLPLSVIEREVELRQIIPVAVRGISLVQSFYLITDARRYCHQALKHFLHMAFGVTAQCWANQVGIDPSQGCMPPEVLPLQHTYCRLGTDNVAMPASDVCVIDGSHLPDSSRGLHPLKEIEQNLRDPLLKQGLGGFFRVVSTHQSIQKLALPIGHSRNRIAQRLPFSLPEIQFFQAAAHLGSFARAAWHYKYTPSTLTYRMKTLGEKLGMQLMISGNKSSRVQLTEAGLVLHYYAERIIGLLDNAMQVMKEVATGHTGKVLLGASQTTGTYIMPRLIGMFRARNPMVAVNLQVKTGSQICAAVEAGSVDVALIGGDVPEHLRDKLHVSPYAADELVLIVSPQHPFASRKAITKDELYSLGLLSMSESSTVQAAQAKTLQRCGIKWTHLRVVMELNSVEAIKNAVQYNLGAAFVSASAIEKEIELGFVVRVPIQDVRLMRTLYMVCNPATHFSPAAKKFMADMLELNPEADPVSAKAQPGLGHTKSRPWERHWGSRQPPDGS